NNLESWGDAEPKRGNYSLIQPTISPLFNTRQSEVSLLTWADSETLDKTAEQPYYEYLKASWEQNMFPEQNDYATFQAFWDSSLHGGIFETMQNSETGSTCTADGQAAAAKISKPSGSEIEISFYEPINIGAGQYANNP